ncbi:nucleotidyl transferase AbiEii/AbiGii toxin family protein [Patescibacteria group bacterium]|nr:nucleotidyl transferase AbiEii/AbiGii toxin family protein [Patescibacteria group bacterium]
MRKEVLNTEQTKLLSLVKLFSKDFGLVGGTAIALQLGHRQSVDFDLFTNTEFNNFTIRKKINGCEKIAKVLVDENDEYTVVVGGVKITFFYYPFEINFSKKFNQTIKLPDLLTLAAMKAYTLGRRAKWKDYVDLYFIMKNGHSITEINKKAKQIFLNDFNEKMFRVQLAYFKDIDYSEKIIYSPGFEIDDKIIKKELINFSLA